MRLFLNREMNERHIQYHIQNGIQQLQHCFLTQINGINLRIKADHHHYLFLFFWSHQVKSSTGVKLSYRKIKRAELNVIAAICRPLLVPKHKLWRENNPVSVTATDHFCQKSSGAASGSYKYVRQIKECQRYSKDEVANIQTVQLVECRIQLFKTLKAGGSMTNKSIHNTEKGNCFKNLV